MSVFDLTPLANFNPRRIVVACNNALDVVIAFIKAWTGHDIDTAADYVVFDGSMQQSTGKITRDQMTLDSHQAHNAKPG
jgi:hypothetical protein